jgi:general secretion pathway protein A
MREEQSHLSFARPRKPVLPPEQLTGRIQAALNYRESGTGLVQPPSDGRGKPTETVLKQAKHGRSVDGKITGEVTDKRPAGAPSRAASGSAFESCPDACFFYPSYQHIEGLNRFRYALTRNMNYLCLLTGEFGSGKTFLARLFLDELWQDRNVHSAYVVAGRPIDEEATLKSIISQITFIPEPFLHGDRVRLQDMLKEFLQRTRVIGKEKLVLVVDEVEQLSSSDQLFLQNITQSRGASIVPLLCILIGNRNLEQKLAEWPQLQSRIGFRFHLTDFSRADTQAYIMHRLAVAHESVGFSNEIYDVIYSTTGGNPRRLDLLCRVLVDVQRLQPARRMTAEQVAQIAADLESPSLPSPADQEAAGRTPFKRWEV